MDLNKNLKKFVCWKCRWLTTEHGFLKRDKTSGPCDKCLGKMTVFQMAWEKDIWLKFVPKQEQPKPAADTTKKEQTGNSISDTRSSNSDTQNSNISEQG
jgi:hypothetical protein